MVTVVVGEVRAQMRELSQRWLEKMPWRTGGSTIAAFTPSPLTAGGLILELTCSTSVIPTAAVVQTSILVAHRNHQ